MSVGERSESRNESSGRSNAPLSLPRDGEGGFLSSVEGEEVWKEWRRCSPVSEQRESVLKCLSSRSADRPAAVEVGRGGRLRGNSLRGG